MRKRKIVSKILGIAMVVLMIGAILGGLAGIAPPGSGVQHALAASTHNYDRQAAYDYAQKYWNKVCSDGCFWETNGSAPYIGKEEPIPDLPNTAEYGYRLGFDCAHFVSCCIGSEPNEIGGGLDFNTAYPYGIPSATGLGKWLVDKSYGVEVYNGTGAGISISDYLEQGDVINYDWDGDGTWDHVALYLGNEEVAAHSKSLWTPDEKSLDWRLVQPGETAKYRFIHIKSSNDLNSAMATDIPNPDAYSCSRPGYGYVDFEAFPDGTNLSSGTISGMQFTTTNGYSWLVGDFATGNYNGKYPNGAYTSHGSHWAWLGINQGSGRIDFPKGPASYISLLVSDGTPVSLDAYGASGNLLATAGPSPSNTNTGHMTELKITRAIADLSYVMVHDSGNYFEIDDVCTNAPGTPNTINGVVDETYFMQTGQHVLGNFIINAVASARQFLHILVGPFDSDVDLNLTRPDGSVVSPSDPGVTYDKTANSIEVSIDDALPGQWGYDIIANQLEAGGENIHIVAQQETILIVDTTPPSVAMVNPPSGYALQDGVTFIASANDTVSGVNSVTFSIRKDNGSGGRHVGYEDIPAIQDPATGNWSLLFDTLQLQDGWYVVVVKATDNAGNVRSITVPYSIRNNWGVIEMLPATPNNNAGGTIPVKFSLRVLAKVDQAQPFVYNEDLTIKIYITGNPGILLHTAVFGTRSRDYQIDTSGKKYITNLQTLKGPKQYTVQIWRMSNHFLVGGFHFQAGQVK